MKAFEIKIFADNTVKETLKKSKNKIESILESPLDTRQVKASPKHIQAIRHG